MSATNSTTHYELPEFLSTDKPAWLVDWNGAMNTIDSAIYEAKQAADSAAASVSSIASDLATLSGTVSTQGTSISTLSETLTTAVGNINTINSLIGNGTPTTTDQTIIGAINEINARTGEADGISYDNTDSGLTATNVQGAIDEINASLTDHLFGTVVSITKDTNYTVPADGYIKIGFKQGAAAAGKYARLKINTVDMAIVGSPSSVAPTSYPIQSIFVRKGMIAEWDTNDTTAMECVFVPLT